MSDKLEQIAAGGEFDVVDAVRLLAKQALVAAKGTQAGTRGAGKDAGMAGGGDTTQAAAPQTMEGLAGLLNSRLAAVLARAGYADAAALQAAADADLLAVEGVSPRALTLIREKVGR